MTTILFVEDNPVLRVTYAEICKMRGYEYLLARNGKEALDALALTTVDLIFCDAEMPHVSGYEVLSQVKNDPSRSHIPFVLYTAGDQKRLEEGLTDVLPDVLLHKSGNIEEILATIERLI